MTLSITLDEIVQRYNEKQELQKRHSKELKLKFLSALGNRCQRCGRSLEEYSTHIRFNKGFEDLSFLNKRGKIIYYRKDRDKFYEDFLERKIPSGAFVVLCTSCSLYIQRLKRKTWQCSKCWEWFSSEEEMRNHKKEVHAY